MRHISAIRSRGRSLCYEACAGWLYCNHRLDALDSGSDMSFGGRRGDQIKGHELIVQ